MGVLQNCYMIWNMENMQVKAAKNDDESSIVLTSIIITEHHLDGSAGQLDLAIVSCTPCTNSMTIHEVGAAGVRIE